LRLFVATKDVKDVEDPSTLCTELLDYINEFLHFTGPVEKKPPSYHQELAVESLHILIHCASYVARDVAQSAIGVSAIFDLLSVPPDSPLLTPAVSIVKTLVGESDFINVLVVHTQFITALLSIVCSSAMPTTSLAILWDAVEAISVHAEGLQALLNVSAVSILLGLVFNVPGFQSTFQNRQSAISLLGKFLWSPAKGPVARAILLRFVLRENFAYFILLPYFIVFDFIISCRYFPEPIVILLRSKSGEILSVLDSIHETPELIWSTEMQKEIRMTLSKQLLNNDNTINWRPQLTDDFFVEYKQIMEELYLGEVYVRLYMRQPTFKLTNPIRFLECLISRWEDAMEAQLVEAKRTKGTMDSDEKMSYSLIVGKEDFLSLVTSCIVCAVRAEKALVDHMVMWGFPDRVVTLLQNAMDKGRRGIPVICILRLLQLITEVHK